MALLQRRQLQLGSSRNSSISKNKDHRPEAINEPLWMFSESEGEMDIPAKNPARTFTRQLSKADLHIDTYAEPELHDHYLSSEEEPSPSPDSLRISHDGGLEQGMTMESVIEDTFEDTLEDTLEDPLDQSGSFDSESESESEIAVAVPMTSVGRPRLVNIIKLAPMQSRKRNSSAEQPLPQLLHKRIAALYALSEAEPRTPCPTNEATELIVPKRESRLSTSYPKSVIAEEENAESVDCEERFDCSTLERRPSSCYSAYDPYYLEPPHLVPSYPSSNQSINTRRLKGYTTASISAGWKGITRTWTLGRRSGTQPEAKKRRVSIPIDKE